MYTLLLVLVYSDKVIYYHIALVKNLYISTHLLPIDAILYPMKTPETRGFLLFSGSVSREH